MANKSFSCFKEEGMWLKGNLHSHTTNSDGEATPEELVDWYLRHGYDFLAITDHDVITDPEPLKRDGIVLIPGIEFGHSYGDFTMDMLGINIKELPEYLDPERKGKVVYPENTDTQRIIDLVREQDGEVIMCHPYFMHNMTEPYLHFHSYLGMEAYNFVCQDWWARGHQEIFWDALLHRGMKLMGFATDDSHAADFGHAWIMVKAAEKSVDGIMRALREGCFYSTTGIEIFDVECAEGKARIEFDRPCDVVFANNTYTKQMIRAYENTTRVVDGVRRYYAEYQMCGEESYLRIQLMDADGNSAYTNPIYSKDGLRV